MCVRRTTLEIMIDFVGASAVDRAGWRARSTCFTATSAVRITPIERHGVTGERGEQDEDRGDRAEPSGLAVLRPVVKKPEAQQVDRDRNRHGGAGADRADLRVMCGLVHARRPAPHPPRPRRRRRGSVRNPRRSPCRRLVSRSCTGRSKYTHHIEYTISNPPTMSGTSAGRASPEASADWMATVAARIDSPSTISVSSPYRSAMCCGCHVVGAARSAHTGTASSNAASARNPGTHRRGTTEHARPTPVEGP